MIIEDLLKKQVLPMKEKKYKSIIMILMKKQLKTKNNMMDFMVLQPILMMMLKLY